MRKTLLDYIAEIEDPRIPGMVVYPLTEILLVVFLGQLCRTEDIDEMEYFATCELDWLRAYLPFKRGIAPAQTIRRTLSRLKPRSLDVAFSCWMADLCGKVEGVIAIDGKTLRGSKQDRHGKSNSALHLVHAYAHEAGMLLAQCATEEKSNEITAIPALLEMLNVTGAIITIDAMGTQTEIASQIIKGGGDYVLALKGNQSTLHEDVKDWFADPVLAATCTTHHSIDSGHGRVEERTALTADAQWLAKLHPAWAELNSITAIVSKRCDKKSGAISTETRFYISSLAPDPEQIAKAIRAHWDVENKLHWLLDVAFREDECRIRKDHAAQNLAMIRRCVLNMLKREKSPLSIKRKRLKALLDREFRTQILAC